MTDHISLLTELKSVRYVGGYKHFAPDRAKTFLISN